MKEKIAVLAVGGWLAASMLNAYAQPYYVSGDFNGWALGTDQMTGGPTQYDFTISGQTPGGYGDLKVNVGTWSSAWPNQNLRVRYDGTGSATIHFYPGGTTDGWIPLANRIGYDDPGNLTWGMAGGFNGWDGTQTQLAPLGSGVYSNSIIVASAGTFGFKFQSPPGSWNNIYFGSDFGNGGSDGSYTTTNSPQTVPVVLDLPRGRYLIGSLAPPAVTNEVIFAVDMTYQIQLGNFTPGSSVFVAGGFNGWPAASSGTGLLLVNDPPYMGGSNTNIYYGTNTFIGLPNSSVTSYKFNQNDPLAPNTGWETSSDRSLVLMSTNGTLRLPVVVFSDVYPADVLTSPTPVFFSVDMNGAVGTDSHAFTAGDHVYLNGEFPSWYAWAGGINPSPAPPGFELFQQGSSTIYTNTVMLPAGTPIWFQYKYGMDASGINGGPSDNEAAIGQNHRRVLRSTASNPYSLPTDTFAHMYQEPFFSVGNTSGAQLTVGAPSAGKVPVMWLGRPGAHLQVKSTLAGGSWQDINETDGATWTSGYASTNGLVSVTNWPVVDKAFFRLVKP